MNEEGIFDWFNVRYPGGPDWTSADFDAYRNAPIELRMFISMSKLEGEIPNGGLPQLLWNTFYHWRRLLDDCETGYELIGSIPQRDAIREFRTVFEAQEAECKKYISQCIQKHDFSYFGKWCEYAAPRMDSEREKLFWTTEYAELEKKRKAWIDKNQQQLIELMGETGKKDNR